MKNAAKTLVGWLALAGALFLPAAENAVAQEAKRPAVILGQDFVKTNGEFVTIDTIMIKTNSPMNNDDFKILPGQQDRRQKLAENFGRRLDVSEERCPQRPLPERTTPPTGKRIAKCVVYPAVRVVMMWRCHELGRLVNSGLPLATDLTVKGAFEVIKDYPKDSNAYDFLMSAVDRYEFDGEPAKARALASELLAGSTPERIRKRARGVLHRLDTLNRPMVLRFTALDGSEVSLAAMRGKVVQVDFWGTDCIPCVEELPRVKAAYDKYHTQDLEVIGISNDRDKEHLRAFLAKKRIPWPQECEGDQFGRNKLMEDFGINGIPRMFLVDRKGVLRFDTVQARDAIPHPRSDKTRFEEKIEKLLAEDP